MLGLYRHEKKKISQANAEGPRHVLSTQSTQANKLDRMSSIPGYVVPGQIVCPVLDKKNGHIRKYIPGHGVTLTEIDGGVAAITATVVGKVGIRDVTPAEGDASSGSETSAKVVRRPATQHVKRFVFEVNIEDKFHAVTSANRNPQVTKVTRASSAPLPEVGDVVLARVTKLTLRQAHVEILVVEAAGAVAADSGVGLNGAIEGTVPASIVSGGAGGAGGGDSVFSAAQTASASSTASDVGEGFGGIIRVQDVRITERDKVKIVNSFRPGDIVRALVVSLSNFFFTKSLELLDLHLRCPTY